MTGPGIAEQNNGAGPPGPVAWLNDLLDACGVLFKILAALCLGTMVALNLFNVISRSAFGSAHGWIFNWTLLLFAWMLLLGFFAYVRERRDVVVDIFMARLPAIPRRIGALFVCLVGVAVMVALLRGAPPLIRLQMSNMEAIALPMYVRSAPLFVSAGLVLLHFALDFVLIAFGWRPAFPRDAEPEVKGAVE